MEWFLKQANTIVIRHFHRLYGFLAASFLLIVAFLFLFGLFPKESISFISYLYVIGGFELALLLFWLIYTFWIPKNNQKHTGLVICIHADTDEVEQSLKKDFIETVKRKFTNGEVGEVFNIVVVKNHLAKKYNNFSSIKKLHKRVRGHIYIFGETKKRQHGGEHYFLSLDGWVLHRPVAKQVSQELSKDFLATLPKSINFQEAFAFAGFQISADIVVRSVEYISGIAAAISGNPFLAIRLHTDLKNQISSSGSQLPGDKAILGKVNGFLADEYAVVAAYYLNKEDKNKTYENLRLALGLNPNCYQALIVESIVSFSWENNPQKSLTALKKCHNVADPTWRYNEAFVRFWLGQYPSAWKQCEKIKNQNYPNDPDVSRQVTEFNENLLHTVTDKPALYFWLGFNYYFKQNNYPLALQYLETFTGRADSSMTLLTQKANGWLVDIKREGGWN